ncbi:MAG: hypothetical protein M1818_003850 [Claussenomyces sp. TS43310]|nr:MAG: hypothetical protein M1818_003850 [Claussenomyces sp. TS43310]
MATPTHGKPGHHVAATPPVSTPFSHLAAFSPHGLKSVVPSPQQFKKSPANSNPAYGHPTNSSFGAMNFDSPTAAALGALPALGDISLDAAGGLLLGGVGRSDEDEKKRKMQQVIDILKVNKGRVSEEGIERLARRVGLECLWEDQIGSAGSMRTLIIAGTGLSVDIDFTNNKVDKVTLSFPESPAIVTKHAAGSGQILLRDLQLRPYESPLTKMLDKFSANLERLAALDKLSVMPTLNCHEAIAGIYESLKRLYEWEVAKLKEKDSNNDIKGDDVLTRTVMCTKSGRPIMNARDQVGLSLDYWHDNRTRTRQGKSEEEKEAKTWSLVIECAPSSAIVYPSVRVSDKWISAEIEKENPTGDEILMAGSGVVVDWQEPDNVLLPNSDSSKIEGQMEGIEQDLNSVNTRYPDVTFLARFSPPLAVPYGVAEQIYNSTGATMDHYHLSTFDGLIIPTRPEEKPESDGSHRRLTRQRSIPTFSNAHQEVLKTHKGTLTVPKLDYGRSLTELPFSHPRQLVDMLPTLRQYAMVSMLIERSFGTATKDFDSDDAEPDLGQTLKDEYEAFMAEAMTETRSETQFEKMPVDVFLYTQPAPGIRVTFPFRSCTADVWFEIGVNGSVTVESQNVLGEGGQHAAGEDKQGSLKVADLARILEVTKDLNVFVEFIKKRLE